MDFDLDLGIDVTGSTNEALLPILGNILGSSDGIGSSFVDTLLGFPGSAYLGIMTVIANAGRDLGSTLGLPGGL